MVSSTTPMSFDTLKRENLFRNPPKDKSAFPALLEAVQPHIDSFNAVTAEGGLLDLARQDIGVKSVFDRKNEDGGLGNKLSCKNFLLAFFFLSRNIRWAKQNSGMLVRVDKIYIGKPRLSDRDKTSLRREIYPAEVRRMVSRTRLGTYTC